MISHHVRFFVGQTPANIHLGTVSLGERPRACPESNISEPLEIERLISIIARDLKEAILEAESEEKIKPLSAWKDKYFEKDGKGN